MSKQQKKYRWLEDDAIEVQGALVFLEGVLEDIDHYLPSCGYQRRIYQITQEQFLKSHDSMRAMVDLFQHKLKLDGESAEERKKL